MNAQQNSYVQMFDAVIATSEAHPSVFSSFSAYAEPYHEFKLRNGDLAAAIARQGTTSTGTTEAKKAIRLELDTLVQRLGATLVLWGKQNNAMKQVSDADVPPSNVARMREKVLVGHTTKLLSLAADLPDGALTGLQLPSTHIADTTAKLAAFTTALGTPRHQVAESVEGTKELEAIIDEMMNILEDKMDPAIEVLQYTEPSFAGEYRTAREIVDAGSSTRELTVLVLKGQTGAVIQGAQALITPGNVEKQTGPSGSFYINNMEEGDYQMAVSANGYSSQTVPFHITDGQATVVNVEMVAQGQAFPGS